MVPSASRSSGPTPRMSLTEILIAALVVGIAAIRLALMYGRDMARAIRALIGDDVCRFSLTQRKPVDDNPPAGWTADNPGPETGCGDPQPVDIRHPDAGRARDRGAAREHERDCGPIEAQGEERGENEQIPSEERGFGGSPGL